MNSGPKSAFSLDHLNSYFWYIFQVHFTLLELCHQNYKKYYKQRCTGICFILISHKACPSFFEPLGCKCTQSSTDSKKHSSQAVTILLQVETFYRGSLVLNVGCWFCASEWSQPHAHGWVVAKVFDQVNWVIEFLRSSTWLEASRKYVILKSSFLPPTRLDRSGRHQN